MFYSQFILAKKGPLGTIWIAAHLERKLKKNQVADTDIGDSVDSILFPDVPIALRLSSHLLLGVVRIYSKKVNYLFHDCSEALLKVKQAFRSTAVDLPPEESTAPYHSITLPETFDLDDFELPYTVGNFDDRNVSTKEQITLQDALDGSGFSNLQFGLDERFGDGDACQIGLDFEEEFLRDSNLMFQQIKDGIFEHGEGSSDMKNNYNEGQPSHDMETLDADSNELSKLLGGDRGKNIISDIPSVNKSDDFSHRLMFNIRTPDLNEVFMPDNESFGGPSRTHDIDMDPTSPEFNESKNASITPIAQEVECVDAANDIINAISTNPESANVVMNEPDHTLNEIPVTHMVQEAESVDAANDNILNAISANPESDNVVLNEPNSALNESHVTPMVQEVECAKAVNNNIQNVVSTNPESDNVVMNDTLTELPITPIVEEVGSVDAASNNIGNVISKNPETDNVVMNEQIRTLNEMPTTRRVQKVESVDAENDNIRKVIPTNSESDNVVIDDLICTLHEKPVTPMVHEVEPVEAANDCMLNALSTNPGSDNVVLNEPTNYESDNVVMDELIRTLHEKPVTPMVQEVEPVDAANDYMLNALSTNPGSDNVVLNEPSSALNESHITPMVQEVECTEAANDNIQNTISTNPDSDNVVMNEPVYTLNEMPIMLMVREVVSVEVASDNIQNVVSTDHESRRVVLNEPNSTFNGSKNAENTANPVPGNVTGSKLVDGHVVLQDNTVARPGLSEIEPDSVAVNTLPNRVFCAEESNHMVSSINDMPTVDHAHIEDVNSCKTSNISFLNSDFHLKSCTSVSRQTNLVSPSESCTVTPMVDKDMHFRVPTMIMQGPSSDIAINTTIQAQPKLNDVWLGQLNHLPSSEVPEPERLSFTPTVNFIPPNNQNMHFSQGMHFRQDMRFRGSSSSIQGFPSDNATVTNRETLKQQKSNEHINQFHYLSSPQFSEPERSLYAPAVNYYVPNHIEKQPVDKGVIEFDGSVNRTGTLSGKKRPLIDETPYMLNTTSFSASGAHTIPPPKRQHNDFIIPQDDDLLASILAGRKTPALKVGPSPPVSKPPTLKRPRLTQKAGLLKRRKVLFDDPIILHADTIRQQLINTDDIHRMRKRVPCTIPEIWWLQKNSLDDDEEEKDIFSDSLFTGISEKLKSLSTRKHAFARNLPKQGISHDSNIEVIKEFGGNKSPLIKEFGGNKSPVIKEFGGNKSPVSVMDNNGPETVTPRLDLLEKVNMPEMVTTNVAVSERVELPKIVPPSTEVPERVELPKIVPPSTENYNNLFSAGRREPHNLDPSENNTSNVEFGDALVKCYDNSANADQNAHENVVLDNDLLIGAPDMHHRVTANDDMPHPVTLNVDMHHHVPLNDDIAHPVAVNNDMAHSVAVTYNMADPVAASNDMAHQAAVNDGMAHQADLKNDKATEITLEGMAVDVNMAEVGGELQEYASYIVGEPNSLDPDKHIIEGEHAASTVDENLPVNMEASNIAGEPNSLHTNKKLIIEGEHAASAVNENLPVNVVVSYIFGEPIPLHPDNKHSIEGEHAASAANENLPVNMEASYIIGESNSLHADNKHIIEGEHDSSAVNENLPVNMEASYIVGEPNYLHVDNKHMIEGEHDASAVNENLSVNMDASYIVGELNSLHADNKHMIEGEHDASAVNENLPVNMQASYIVGEPSSLHADNKHIIEGEHAASAVNDNLPVNVVSYIVGEPIPLHRDNKHNIEGEHAISAANENLPVNMEALCNVGEPNSLDSDKHIIQDEHAASVVNENLPVNVIVSYIVGEPIPLHPDNKNNIEGEHAVSAANENLSVNMEALCIVGEPNYLDPDNHIIQDGHAASAVNENLPVNVQASCIVGEPNSLDPDKHMIEAEHAASAVDENLPVNVEAGIDVENNHVDHAAAKKSDDFNGIIDNIDTDFLNVDDAVELEEDTTTDVQNADDAKSLETAGWSARTRGVANYLKIMFDQESGRGRKSIAVDQLLAGKTRKEASRLFFETLVLTTRDYIHVEQETPFAYINVQPRTKLLKSEF